ncbi:MAG: MFS transporter, partial [Bacteroidia bacterium]
ILISILGFCGLFFLLHPSVRKFKELIEEEQEHATKTTSKSKDWFIIIKALVPTLIIATGAGLTIPFISLFFDRVHHLNAAQFSIISTIASILVAYGALMVPKIKKHIGYKIAIPTTQSLAIVSLIALATTQLYSQYSLAVIVAIVCYIIRQPLMNMAGPMTTELVLTYVGKRNREITSAFTSAIWSGSWVISGLMVNLMFILGFQFVTIFLITSLLYALGVVLYYFLILEYTKKEERGEIDA